ncbi:3-dehydroquinate synthase [Planctomycetia bacterium]|nr:3-dehydroquinate synthase [Planctomycetia bacterium]
MATIRLHLPSEEPPGPDQAASMARENRSYDIVVGPGVIVGIGPALKAAAASRALLIADAAVLETHAARVAESLRSAGITTESIAVPSGEAAKSLDQAGRLWDACARLAIDRQTHVVAVGGGVVGDLAGFVAATFARGLPVWQVPTTVIAQVDSGIGGKTGINLDAGKNLVGAFWQPRGVFADIDVLATLPDREFASGFAEVVKYGMILDAGFFEWLEENASRIMAREPSPLTAAVERSAALKALVVERDERETTGLRVALNYGHTFAHAIETVFGYGALLHGEAVAIGMARAARLAAMLGRLPEAVVDRQDRLLTLLSLPTALSAGINPTAEKPAADALIDVMRRDKKSLAGRLRFVLPDRIGHVELVDGIPETLVRRALGD